MISSKLKGIHLKDRLTANSGRRSGHGRVVLLFQVMQMAWDGSPATEQMGSDGSGSNNWRTWYECKSVIMFHCAKWKRTQDTANISIGSKSSHMAKRRELPGEKPSNYQQENLKEDCQQMISWLKVPKTIYKWKENSLSVSIGWTKNKQRSCPK